MDTQLKTTIQIGRGNHYYSVMRTSIFAEVAIAAIIVLGETSGHALGLQALIIGVAVFAVLAGDTALKDISNLIKDMDGEIAGTTFGKAARATPYPVLRAISSIVHIAIALALLFSI